MQPKIVFIASYPDSLINFRLHLIKDFLALNYRVVVIAPQDEKVMAILIALGVKYIPIELERNGSNPLKDISLIAKLFFSLRDEKPSLVFSYTIKPVIYGTLAAKLANVPKIFSMLTGTGYIFSNTNFKSRVIGYIAKYLFKFSLRFNTKLFFQNKDNVASFLDHGLMRVNHPVAIINGSGVDIDFFADTLLPSTVSFLMVARLLKDKGVHEYVEAARILKSRYPHVTFKLVGWIDTNPNAISPKALARWQEEGFIEYLGKLSDVRNTIAQSAVYVLPSYGEGTPRTVLEAMSMGRPIVTTDVPGCRETVIQGQNGFLVPVCDVDSLVTAMQHFITQPEDIDKMGRASRKIASEKYDVKKVNHCMLSEMGIEQQENKVAEIA